MEKILEHKKELDIKIKKLIEDFALEHKCGYKGNIEVNLIREGTGSNVTVITGLINNVNTVVIL